MYLRINSIVIFSIFFFFKQKTAYEMRISDWSSDVCSSDLEKISDALPIEETDRTIASDKVEGTAVYDLDGERLGHIHNFMIDKHSGEVLYAVKIGRASCRERVCQYV